MRFIAVSRFVLFLLLTASCGRSLRSVDLIVHHAKVYTMDESFTILESFAVKDGRIIAVGTNESIAAMYTSDESIDANGKVILPGFIDAHAHFIEYALGLQECDLTNTKSFEEVIDRVKVYAGTNKRSWIEGRGWDQNDWTVTGWPDRRQLDSLFPSTPILLQRIDGHAALVNGEALRRARISDTTTIAGGELLRYKDGSLTGVLIDNAVELVRRIIPKVSEKLKREALLTAQQNCFAKGLTSVTDAGLLKEDIDLIDQLQKSNELKIRIYAMLSDSTPNYEYYLKTGPYKTDRVNVCSFKFYGDGALGSRGACLLEDYADVPGYRGFLLHTQKHYTEKFRQVAAKGFQLNTHCIGDSAARFVLSEYARLLTDTTLPGSRDRRWRIEHAQVVHPADYSVFGKWKIIPSMQPTHATSDMYWAGDRLGSERLRYAYAHKELKERVGLIALGTDFPVEKIDPLYTFYAAVVRKDLKGYPPTGFQLQNALSRRDALWGMTRWAAYAEFSEKEKGSIAAGCFADFILLDSDPLICSPEKIPDINILATYVQGEKVYTYNR